MTVQNNDVLRVDLEQQCPTANPIMNVYTMRLAGGGPVAEADVLTDLTVIFTALITLIKAVQSTALIYDIIRIINKTQDSEVGIIADFVLDTGDLASDLEPAQSAYGITLSTSRLASVGRKSIGGYESTGSLIGGIVVAARILDLADIGDHLTAQHVESGRTYEYGIDSVPAAAFLPFLTTSITPTVVTQRRRRIGVGG